MLGNAMFRYFSDQTEHATFGTLRSRHDLSHFPAQLHDSISCGIDVLDHDGLIKLFFETHPDAVINCVGLIKQLASANDPLTALPINSIFPHRLSGICALSGARLVHISTDCVFSGSRGNYLEEDPSDVGDLYGKSKHIGEVTDSPHAITLRTSIIGHELHSSHALVDWFLSSSDRVKGYTQAIFSGLPTVELAGVIHDYVLPDSGICGLYHVSAEPIAKYDLLSLIADVYHKEISIIPSDEVCIDRSLNSSRFRSATGYEAPKWPELITRMRHTQQQTRGLIDV